MKIEEVDRLSSKVFEYRAICRQIREISRECWGGEPVTLTEVIIKDNQLGSTSIKDKEFLKLSRDLFIGHLSRKRDELKKEIEEA